MKTRIGTSFGLALMLALGVFATMLALGLFAPSNVTATDNSNAIHIDHTIAQNIAVNSPNTPGGTATYTVTFQNQSTLTSGSGQIFVKFDKLINVPSAIEKERITISASGAQSITVSNPLFDPTITTDSNGDTVVTLTIGDTDSTATGSQSLPEWDPNGDTTNVSNGHILQFSALAGIKNSTVPSSTFAWIDLSEDGITYNVTPQYIVVNRWLSLDDNLDARGKVLTLTGKGFTSGGTATVFLDVNDSRTLESTETVLATSSAAISGGEFTATFTVDTNFGVGTNTINAIDGTGIAANNFTAGSRFHGQTFTLHGKISLSPTSATRGGSVKITLADFSGTGPVTRITIGGVQADLTGKTLTIANNSLSITVTVPATTPLGTQRVDVLATSEGATSRRANLVVGGLSLAATPSTAVANQSITVSGSGFTSASASTPGAIATITVGSVTQLLLTNGSAVTTVTMDNSGNLVASFKIPNNDVTRTAGSHVLRITDNGNRIGETTITVPSRVLIIDPASSKRGSTVSYNGSGFVASKTATLTFLSGGTTSTVDTVTADSAGNISGTFKVPTSAGIPSTNTVTATSAFSSSTDGVQVQLTGSATHKVPGATVTADPISSASGETITITGTGFPGFVGLDVFTIGGVSAKPSPTPATDGDGIFVMNALVPELATGSHSLVATVGTGNTAVTATSSFTVVSTPTTPVVTSDDTSVIFADAIAADTLVRVFSFDNATKTWSFFDPRPAFAAANTYTTASGGDIVWVSFTEETVFQGATLSSGFSLIVLD